MDRETEIMRNAQQVINERDQRIAALEAERDYLMKNLQTIAETVREQAEKTVSLRGKVEQLSTRNANLEEWMRQIVNVETDDERGALQRASLASAALLMGMPDEEIKEKMDESIISE